MSGAASCEQGYVAENEKRADKSSAVGIDARLFESAMQDFSPVRVKVDQEKATVEGEGWR